MPSYNLSGSAISNTYQRLLQTDGVNIYDGTGSLFNFSGSSSTTTGSFTGSFTGSLLGTASYALSASYALTASYVPIIDGGTF
jgi:hypothetical protein